MWVLRRRSPERGSFLRVPLPDGSFGFGRVVGATTVAFYNWRTDSPSVDLDELESKPVLFTQTVAQRGLAGWAVLGVRELVGDVARPFVTFMQDLADPQRCTISDSAGMRRSASPEECIGLEKSSVWEAHHIEQRLLDALEGRENEDERLMRVRLPPF